jgi:hypothetical protein
MPSSSVWKRRVTGTFVSVRSKAKPVGTGSLSYNPTSANFLRRRRVHGRQDAAIPASGAQMRSVIFIGRLFVPSITCSTRGSTEKDGEVEAYALKELRISPQRLLRVTRGLQTIQRIYEIAEITVIKFWYDPAWPEPQFPDLVLGEFSLRIPLQIRRSSDDKMFVVEVLPLASC